MFNTNFSSFNFKGHYLQVEVFTFIKFHKEGSLPFANKLEKMFSIIKMWVHWKSFKFLFVYFPFLPNVIFEFFLSWFELIWIVQINFNCWIYSVFFVKYICCVLMFYCRHYSSIFLITWILWVRYFNYFFARWYYGFKMEFYVLCTWNIWQWKISNLY